MSEKGRRIFKLGREIVKYGSVHTRHKPDFGYAKLAAVRHGKFGTPEEEDMITIIRGRKAMLGRKSKAKITLPHVSIQHKDEE